MFVQPGARLARGARRYEFREGPVGDTTVMIDAGGSVVGIFRARVILWFVDDRRLLVESLGLAPAPGADSAWVTFQLVDIERLKGIDDVTAVVGSRGPGEPLAMFDAGPIESVSVPDQPVAERLKGPVRIPVPRAFSELEPVFRFDPYWTRATEPNTGRRTVTWLIVVDSKAATSEFRPQFWWTKPARDFDVLASQAARDVPEPDYLAVFVPELKRVGGSGWRMRPFLLDEAGRELAGWAAPDDE